MKQYLKSYHMFLPSSHVLALLSLYLFYPLVIVGMSCGMRYMTMFSYITFSLVGSILIFTEAILDYFSFGGIQSKEVNYLEYIKTSEKGNRFIKNAFKVDFLRRTILITIVLLISYKVSNVGAKSEEAISIVLLVKGILGTCVIAQINTVCTRFFSNMWVNISISYGFSGIFCLIQFLTWKWNNQSRFCCVFAVAYICLMILTYYFSNKGVKGSYYD